MKKRVTAAVLWFFAGWYAGATIAFVLGLPPVLGPIFATAASALIAGDPRAVIWTRPAGVGAAHTGAATAVSNPA